MLLEQVGCRRVMGRPNELLFLLGKIPREVSDTFGLGAPPSRSARWQIYFPQLATAVPFVREARGNGPI